MPLTVASPPLAPVGFDVDVYVVLDDFGSIGRSYRETAEERADRESLIRDMMSAELHAAPTAWCRRVRTVPEDVIAGDGTPHVGSGFAIHG